MRSLTKKKQTTENVEKTEESIYKLLFPLSRIIDPLGSLLFNQSLWWINLTRNKLGCMILQELSMRNRFDELCSFTMPCRTEVLHCPEWPLATYFCFLITTVRNLSFFMKNHILGTLAFTGSKFMACFNIFLRAQPWDLPVCWVLDWMILFISKLLWSEWTVIV